MGYAPSPRPTFTEPTHIPYEQVTRHLWGDEAAGEVARIGADRDGMDRCRGVLRKSLSACPADVSSVLAWAYEGRPGQNRSAGSRRALEAG